MFHFGKKKKPERPTAGRKPDAAAGAQKRSSFRMPVEFAVSYTLGGRVGPRGATANDLSAGGLRLLADEDFLKQSALALRFHVPDDFLETMKIDKEVYEETPFGRRTKTEKVKPKAFAEFHVNAKVLVPFFDLMRKKFAYGVAFVDVEAATTEELQRFIHLWQLNYIRQRAKEHEE
ncbi:MAG: PilZ domain-containing protein [Candidatus Eremiobacteraeota bacterium]|nr:PilZ domain-containing protein [Candidatus Eremiobacteraeota bacterium]